MKESESSSRAFVSVIAARAAFGLTLLAVAGRVFNVPTYCPIERRWTLSPEAGLKMLWFGDVLAALLVAGVVFAITWLGTRIRTPSTRTVIAIARAGALVLLVDFVYFGWTMSHEDITPPPACIPNRW